ncbi:Zn(2)-C6 fungal-type DNA-binding domain [Phaffia rhodozyma]|uniref:Zn(2)-C6 fungal-type DNA-binding domain n=1 Tax=Phaffia rhodozyma TaxID=264483 RepID=A0A0F7SIX0_PHARH|nr:Zn(2)-C6 fungal-type DNA-binding domain [Phaffia rhodozyma]
MGDSKTSRLIQTDRPPLPSGTTRHIQLETAKEVKPRSGRASACACRPCKKAHLACDDSRPCKRCVTLSKVDLCVDVVQKKRGRPKLHANQNSTSANSSRFRTPPTQRGSVTNRTSRIASSQSVRQSTSTSPQNIGPSSAPMSRESRPLAHQDIGSSVLSSSSTSYGYSCSADSSLSPRPSLASTPATTITLIATTDLYILRCSASSLQLLGREASSMSHRWLSSLLVEDDLWATEQIRDPLTYPTGHRVRTSRSIEELIERLDDAMLESPVEGTSYPDRDVRLKRADGSWEGYNMRMHLGRAGGLDLGDLNTYSNAYIVISLLPLLSASPFLIAQTFPQPNQHKKDDARSSSHYISTHPSPSAFSERPTHNQLGPSTSNHHHHQSNKNGVLIPPSDIELAFTPAYSLSQPIKQDRPTLPPIALLTSTLPSESQLNINHPGQLRPMSSPSYSSSLFRRPFDTDLPDRGGRSDGRREQEHGVQATFFSSSASSFPSRSSSSSFSSCPSYAVFHAPMNQTIQPVHPNRSSSLVSLVSDQRSPPFLSRRSHPNFLPSTYPSSASASCPLKRPSVDLALSATQAQSQRDSSFSTASSLSEPWTRPSTSSDSERRSSSMVELPGLETLFSNESGPRPGFGTGSRSFRTRNVGLGDGGDDDGAAGMKTRPSELRIWRSDEDVTGPLNGRS